MFNRIDIKTLFSKKHSFEKFIEQRIKQFDTLIVRPCKIIGYVNGEEIGHPCRPNLASYWTVFGRYSPKSAYHGLESLKDFSTEAKAQEYRQKLMARHKHLAGRIFGRPSSQAPQGVECITL